MIDLVSIGDESAELGVAFVEPGGRTVLYREYSSRAMGDDWQAWRAAHPGREIVIDDNLFLQRDCTGFAHDVLTTASMETSRAHALEERSGWPSTTTSAANCEIGEATDSDAQQVLDLLISGWPNFDPDEKWVDQWLRLRAQVEGS